MSKMLSEQYRLAAKSWCELDSAANLLEESKSAVLSQMINRQFTNDPKIALNRAETNAKGSQEWKDYIIKMVKAREEANLAKIKVKWIEMRHREEQSVEASARAEARL
jgi:hypothetical protein